MSEDSYFQEREQEKLAALRRKKQLAALRDQEKKDIATALGTDEEIAEAALELGFDAATAPILQLIPLLQVAWADGSVSSSEKDEVLAIAAKGGIKEGTPAYEFLALLISEEPSPLFFERTNAVIAKMVGDGSGELIERCRQIAQASGGFFGIFNAESTEEKEILDHLVELFGVNQ